MSQTPRRPNVLLIYTDQQRYDTLGANGNDLIRTPNLDRLAAEGVTFSRAYVTTPLCVPSRVALFTGRYNHANLSYNNGRLMYETETDYVSRFRAAGYETSLVGKNHCYPKDRVARTFDYAWDSNHCAVSRREPHYQKVADVRGDKMQVPFAEDPLHRDEDVTATTFRKAREYLKGRSNDKPFLMWLSIADPHPPYMVPEPYATMYDDVDVPDPAWREGECDDKPYRQRLIVEWNRYDKEYPDGLVKKLKRIYWGMVSYIDDELGALVAFLKERGLYDNTIIMFTSDHGDYMGDHRMIRKGPHLYEALVHVPLIAHWPGRFKPRVTDAMVANIDIMPTLAEICGVDDVSGTQGRSFAKVLAGACDKARTCVFLEHGNPGTPPLPDNVSREEYERLENDTGHHLCDTISRGRVKGVRTDRYKYCVTPGDVDELYDLEADADELVNLARRPEHGHTVVQHRTLILDWLIETEDTVNRRGL